MEVNVLDAPQVNIGMAMFALVAKVDRFGTPSTLSVNAEVDINGMDRIVLFPALKVRSR